MSIYNTASFIEKAKEKHNSFFSYKKVAYVNTTTKIIIICPNHGEFLTNPIKHLLSKHGCSKCAVSFRSICRTKTLISFIEKANKVHNNTYDYSQSIYLGDKIKCIIICKNHGPFQQRPNNHLSGQGCPHCRATKISNAKIKSVDKFIREANKKHQFKYDYTKSNYTGERNKITIICPAHGIFNQKPFDHLQGNGCQQCGVESRIESQKDTTESFIIKASLIHNNRYDYSLVKYLDNLTPIQIICTRCKQTFKQKPNNHLQGNGCSFCRQSKGEIAIEDFLKQSKLIYCKQHRFKDCKNKKPLPFDFGIYNHDILIGLIEYHGFQHYDVRSKFYENHGDISYRQHNDSIKRAYCLGRGIPLLEIPYWNKKEIPTIITNFLQTIWPTRCV